MAATGGRNRNANRNGEEDEDDMLVFQTSADVDVVTSFDQMGINEELLRGIYAYGFEKPSAIQQRAVIPIIQGRDVIAQAQSGTGKTSMIALAVCQMIDTSTREYVGVPLLPPLSFTLSRWTAGDHARVFENCVLCFCRVQALILSPTRELAAQTEKVILAIGEYINVQAHSCIGGKSIGEDIRKLEYGVHVVSGTPGRVFDMIKRRTLRTRAIKLLILVGHRTRCLYLVRMVDLLFCASFSGSSSVSVQDESDEMLSRGFKEQIYDVYRFLSPELQVTCFFNPRIPCGAQVVWNGNYDYNSCYY